MASEPKYRIGIRIAVLFALATAAVSSCLFDTRDAAPPGTVVGACTLESPLKAFVCMTNAIASQQDANYERSLSDNFIFSPTVADSLDDTFAGMDPSPYFNFNKDAELQVLGTIFAESDTTTVDFGSPEALINKTTFVRFRATYSFRVVELPDTTIYQGVAQIDVRNEGGNWRVTFWDEIEQVPGFRTWGYLRGITRPPV